MKFLIASQADDYHAFFVKRGLEETGHSVRLLFIADQPTQQKNAVFIDKYSTHYQWTSISAEGSITDNTYDVVWWRRIGKPYIPQNLLHPDDHPIALRENALFYDALTNNLAPGAWWVNAKEAARKANSKLFQLKMAVECGMNIPSTLCSNDPKSIRNFVKVHEARGVIYKPLSINLWYEKKEVKITYTSAINTLDLPQDELLQLTPGIYQEEIKKLYELRITCFGEYLVAAKLNSQSHRAGKIDWRKIPEGELTIEPYRLPQDLQAKIHLFMKKMGLVFGAMDFIVTEEGEYIFLEINEQGQFLWIEDCNPAFKMLDIFINFLVNKSVHFKWDAQKSQHQMTSYFAEVNKQVIKNLQNHVHLTQSVLDSR